MLVYSLVFKYYIRFDAQPNYSIFLFCGLLPWLWLSSGVLEGASSISGSGHLITKSLFPAHLLASVPVITHLCNYVFSLPLLLAFILFSEIPLHWTLLILPLWVLIQFLFILGFSLAFATLNVGFRDIQHLLANALTFLFLSNSNTLPIRSGTRAVSLDYGL